MDKEQKWLQRRCGCISASMLSDIESKSGKITLGVQSAIRSKRFERKRGYSLPVSSREMEIGKEQEKYAVEWFRENHPEIPIIYAQELPEIPFWEVSWAKYGASPDAFSEDESVVVEFKTLVSNGKIEFFCDEHTPWIAKELAVWEEHSDQILGQFISNKKVETIILVKYIYQDDDIMKDNDSPNAPWRGLVFKFERKDYEASIKEMRQRIILFDAMIDNPINPSEYKKGEWVVLGGKQISKP